jgi:hypothetical protein
MVQDGDRWWADVTGADLAHRPKSVVLVLATDSDQGGCYLDGYDREGAHTTRTWHGGLRLAKDWAAAEHAPADIGAWHPIPPEVRDVAAYAIRQART